MSFSTGTIRKKAERFRSHVADEPERRECETFDEHLHPEVRHIPAAVTDDVVEQALQVLVERVDKPELLMQLAAVHLDVACLVDDLRCGIELRVHVRHRLDDLRRADERPLLAMHELAESPRFDMEARLGLLRLVHLLPPGRAKQGVDLVWHPEWMLEVDLERPVEPILADPLAACALVVQSE
jgi:hypothetical protein